MAIVELNEEVRLERNVYYAHDNLASVLQKKGDLDKATAEYREAIRLNRLDAKAHTNLGLMLYTKGEYKEGVLEITEGHRLDPNDPSGLAIYKQYVTDRPRISGCKSASGISSLMSLGPVSGKVVFVASRSRPGAVSSWNQSCSVVSQPNK